MLHLCFFMKVTHPGITTTFLLTNSRVSYHCSYSIYPIPGHLFLLNYPPHSPVPFLFFYECQNVHISKMFKHTIFNCSINVKMFKCSKMFNFNYSKILSTNLIISHCCLKVHFMIHAQNFRHISKIEIFIPVEALRCIMFVWKIFIADYLFGEIIAKFVQTGSKIPTQLLIQQNDTVNHA